MDSPSTIFRQPIQPLQALSSRPAFAALGIGAEHAGGPIGQGRMPGVGRAW